MKIGDTQHSLVNSDLQQIRQTQNSPEDTENLRREEEVTGLSSDEKEQNKTVSTINTEVQKTQDTVLRQQLEQETAVTATAGAQGENNQVNNTEENKEEQAPGDENQRTLGNNELLNSDSVAAIQAAGNIDLRG